MATAGWVRLGASNDLLRELMGSMAGTTRARDDGGEGAADRVKRMRVSELRQELADADLDTDGGRTARRPPQGPSRAGARRWARSRRGRSCGRGRGA